MKHFNTLVLILISVLLFGQSTLAAPTFKDVSTKHSNYEEIEWAVAQGLLKGYSDKTFKPNNYLTEAQFAKIFTRYAEPQILENIDASEESTIVYDYLSSMNIKLKGHTTTAAKNQNFTRIQVAQVFYQFYEGQVAPSNTVVIDWMYAKGLTNGKGVSNNKYTDFGSNDSLKRAHISAFFSRYDKMIQLSETPVNDDEIIQKLFAKELNSTYELIQYDRINLTAAEADEYFVYLRDKSASLVERATNMYIIFSYDPFRDKAVILKKWNEITEYSFLERASMNNLEQMIIWANTGSELQLELTIVAANNSNAIIVTPITKIYNHASFSIKGNSIFIENDQYRLNNGKLVRL